MNYKEKSINISRAVFFILRTWFITQYIWRDESWANMFAPNKAIVMLPML